MAWRRHNRNITHETFYDGTTVDGSRLEKAMGQIADHVNEVRKGDVRQRFVAVQYHSGFQPEDRGNAAHTHNFPWLKALNTTAAGAYNVDGSFPEQAPYNVLRLKGSAIPGVETNAGNLALDDRGQQFAWTRVFHFSRPCVLDSVSVFMRLDTDAAIVPHADTPYLGTYNFAVGPYTYDAANPPPGATASAPSRDVVVLIDVCNPASPEDASLNDVELTRHRWVVNEEPFSLIPSSNQPTAAPTWNDFDPPFDSGGITNVRPLYGRLLEHDNLNIPIHQNARVRLAVMIPDYAGGSDGAPYGAGSWGTIPWYIQAWDTTLTVLEEVQAL